MKDLRELAEKSKLEVVETTSNRSGYPENLQDAVVGFLDFKEAVTFAEEHQLDLVILIRRAGHILYTIEGGANHIFDITDYLLDEDYFIFEDFDYIKESLSEKIDETKSFEELQKLLDKMEELKELIDALAEADKDEIVMKGSKEIVQRYVMNFTDDNKEYIIGAMYH